MATYDPRMGIQGWGADLDFSKRPAVPKERKPPRNLNVHWDDLEQQVAPFEILKSSERPRVTKVFGTSAPPHGLSKYVRKLAFHWSEGDLRHWLTLFAADRVNVIEGYFEDFAQGRIPNVFAESGWPAQWKHSPRRVVVKVASALVFAGIAAGLLIRRAASRQPSRTQRMARKLAAKMR